ncbi:MAG: LysR family transcriptional regulator, partial [Myxococcota bacterium]
MSHWSEIRTAYHVGRLGTISAAAEFLEVHRATVTRHIDALESALGARVFHRHTKGYVPTELGLELMRVAEATEEQFNQLVGRAQRHSEGLTGEFALTSVDILAPVVMPVLQEFLAANPGLILRYLSSRQLLRLEYGEAHCALRLGPRPNQLDQVVQPFSRLELGLYASRNYIAKHGLPKTPAEFAEHTFIGLEGGQPNYGYHQWMQDNVPQANIALWSTSTQVLDQALLSGFGIGIFPVATAELHPTLVAVRHDESWAIPIWLV